MSTTQFMPNATIHLHRHDLPDGLDLGPVVAVDTETMGLNPHRDRLCLVQLSAGDGHAHLVVPHSFDNNDSRLQRGGDFATGEDFFSYCRDAFDWLYRSGSEGRPRLMTISLHG